jgi:hypothetical protein
MRPQGDAMIAKAAFAAIEASVLTLIITALFCESGVCNFAFTRFST